MKIFAVYARLNFIKKPEWLDAFRIKYGYPYTYHVTLKQPSYIQEEEIANVKNILAELFSELKFPGHKIDIVFDKLVIDTPIMIAATGKGDIATLQKEILSALDSYDNSFVKPESWEWEKDFKPHITITDDLEAEKLDQAKVDLGEDVRCEAVIQEIVLTIAQDMTSAESSKDKTVYKL